MIPSGFPRGVPSLQVNTTDLRRRSSAVSLSTPSADEFVTGDAVKGMQKLHGFSVDHIQRMIEFAKRKNVVIAFRPVNPLATSLIEDGYPTKGLEVKGKSAEWGPHAGFIPVDQSLSKAKDVAASNELVRSCIEQGHAVPVPLELSHKRIQELIGEGLISFSENKGAKTFNIKSDVKFGPVRTFTGTISDDKPPKYKVMLDGKPLMVLGKVGGPKHGVPMTADYDILMFAPHISEYGPEDMPRSYSERRGSAVSVASELSASGKSGLAALMQRNSSIESDSEFSDKGTLSHRLAAMMPEINEAFGREPGNELVHHGADTWNPYTDMKANVPSIVFAPDGVGIDGVAVSTTEPALRHLFKLVKDANYHFFGNDRWDPGFVSNRYGLGGSFVDSPSSAASSLRRRSSLLQLDTPDSPSSDSRRPSVQLMRRTSSHQSLRSTAGSSSRLDPSAANSAASSVENLSRRPSGLGSLPLRRTAFQQTDLEPVPGSSTADSFPFTNPFLNAQPQAQDRLQVPAADPVPNPNDDMAARRFNIHRPAFLHRQSYKREGTDPKSNG